MPDLSVASWAERLLMLSFRSFIDAHGSSAVRSFVSLPAKFATYGTACLPSTVSSSVSNKLGADVAGRSKNLP